MSDSHASDRELLIRIDERTTHISRALTEQKAFCTQTVSAIRKDVTDNGKEIKETAAKIRNEVNSNVASIKEDLSEISKNGKLTGKDKSLVYVAVASGVFALLGVIVQSLPR